PVDVAGLIVLREDGYAEIVLDREAAAQGVRLETFGRLLAIDPDGLRADLEGGRSLPANDKLAMLARGFWSQGVRLTVPDGVRLERPVLIRWAVGAPGRGLISRTLVKLGVRASASV